jgi:hypothetical protein
VAAEHLLHVHRGLEALVGEIALDDRRQQAEQVVRLLLGLLVLSAAQQVDLERAPQHQRPRRLIEGARLEQHPPDVRVTMIGSARAAGSRASGDKARPWRRSLA